MISFTAAQIRKFAPLARADIIEALVAGLPKINAAGINTYKRLHYFMANIAEETGGLKSLVENLNYSAAGLRRTFPTRIDAALAQKLAHKPEAIANHVYGGRFGNNRAGDGWKYRGRGLMQTTFCVNYREIGYERNPDELAKPAVALESALFYWRTRDCNRFADADDITGLRRRINGGVNGLEHVRTWFAKARLVFTGAQLDAVDDTLPKGVIMGLQGQLKELGYPVRYVDGIVGPLTVGAISQFQVENGLVVTGAFDKITVDRLKTAKARIVERAFEAPKDSRIADSADKLKKGAGGLLTIILGAEAGALLEQFDAARGLIASAKSLIAPLIELKDMVAPLVTPTTITIVAAAGVFYFAHKIIRARTEDHLTGKTV